MKKKKHSGKVYNDDWPIVAICYDFDKTLSPKDMQNFGLIPKLKCDIGEFWKKSNSIAKENGMDKILSYMKLIIDEARSKNISIKHNDFNNLGKGIELFPGVIEWFDRINNFASELRIHVEHYIISAGIKEIIEGTSIAKYFTEIYASCFLYDAYGAPVWPCQVVNFTTKTQYLFRINKDCLDLGDEDKLNNYMKSNDRRIPFRNFIYIGDSETDIPAMKVVKNGGGLSIGVYNPETLNMDRVCSLLNQERIDYLMPADYRENSRIDVLVKSVLSKISTSESLVSLHRKQDAFVKDLDDIRGFIDQAERLLKDSLKLNRNEVIEISTYIRSYLKESKKHLKKQHSSVISNEEIDATINYLSSRIKKAVSDAKKMIKSTEVSDEQ